jgi:hypothetical protein
MIPEALTIITAVLVQCSFDFAWSQTDVICLIAQELIRDPVLVTRSCQCLKAFILRSFEEDFGRLALAVLAVVGAPGVLQLSGAPLLASREVLELAMAPIRLYFSSFLEALDGFDERLQLLPALAALGIDPAAVSAAAANVFGILLSIRDSDFYISKETALFCDFIFGRLTLESNQQVPPVLTAFVAPIFNDIVQFFYESGPLILDEDGQCPAPARDRWANFVHSSPRRIMDFLKEQPPSRDLCYALANAPLRAFHPAVDPSEFAPLYGELLAASSQISDPLFSIALLYALAQGIGNEDTDVFQQFADFAFKCIIESPSPEICRAGAMAMGQTARRLLDVWQSEPYATMLCENAELYLQRLPGRAGAAMFSLCGRAARNDRLLELLRAPLEAVLAGDPDEPALSAVFAAVREVCYGAGSAFFPPLEAAFLRHAGRVIASAEEPALLDDAVAALAASIVARPTAPSFDELDTVLEKFLARGQLEEAFFRFFAILRAAFPQIEPCLPALEAALVLPVLEAEEYWAPVLAMIAEFTAAPAWFLPLCTNALACWKTAANAAAVAALRPRIRAMQNSEFVAVLPPICAALFGAAMDCMHRDCLPDLGGLLEELVIAARRIGAWQECMAASVNALRQCAKEPHEGEFQRTLERIPLLLESGVRVAFDGFLANLAIMTGRLLSYEADSIEHDAAWCESREEGEEVLRWGVLDVRKRAGE